MDQKNSLDINKILKEYRTEEVFRKKLNEGLAQTGILLENEVESIFFKNKFTVTTGHYHDKDEEGTDTTRQIDILAFKKYGEIKNRYFSLEINVRIVGDCKYYGNKFSCLITKKIRDEHIELTLLRLPIFVNGSYFIYNVHGGLILATDFMDYFGEVFITERIENFNFKTLKSIEKKHKEKNIFDICETQVIPATQSFYELDFTDMEQIYKKIKLINNMSEIKNINVHIPIKIIIPAIFTNKEIIEIKTSNKSKEISDLNPLPFIIYNVAPSRQNKFKLLLEGYTDQAILIINIKYLDYAIKFIENGIKNLMEQIFEYIQSNPESLIKEKENYFKDYSEKFNVIL